MQFLAPISVLVLALASTSAALGINCRGNSNCGGTLCSLHDLVGKASSIPDGNSFSPGQHIVCCTSPGPAPPGSGLCAFTQNTGSSISGADVKRHLQNLVNHGKSPYCF
ncbi:killer toxin [Geopyxis carbonaria]|nr:killer toxin [Geopyxis carbonaria]